MDYLIEEIIENLANDDIQRWLEESHIGSELIKSLNFQNKFKKETKEDHEIAIKKLKRTEKSVNDICYSQMKFSLFLRNYTCFNEHYMFEFKDFESNKEFYSDFIKEVINEYRVRNLYFQNYSDIQRIKIIIIIIKIIFLIKITYFIV
jgi:hypothetical protein